MKSRNEVLALMKEYALKVKDVYGDKLVKIILYGSYARGDYNEDSDIDVMILIDVPPGQQQDNIDALLDFNFDLNELHQTFIMPMTQSKLFFDRLKDIESFFINIEEEGVVLYDSCR